jgi:hypothetical protein
MERPAPKRAIVGRTGNPSRDRSYHCPVKETRGSLVPWALVAACVLLRSGYALLTFDATPADPSWALGYETTRIASHLAEGRGFAMEGTLFGQDAVQPTSWIAPLYPMLVAAVFWLLGTASAAAAWCCITIQILLAGATTLALATTPHPERRVRFGFGFAAGLFAVLPIAIHNATTLIWSTSAEVFVLAMLARMLVGATTPWTRGRAAGAGFAFGASALLNPVLIAPWLVALLARHRRDLTHLAITGATAALVVSPWLLRNQATFGGFVFLKSNFGHELFVGNNPVADGGYHRISEQIPRAYGAGSALLAPVANEIEFAARLGAASRDWIAANPGAFATLCASRAVRFWSAPTIEPRRLGPLAGPHRSAELLGLGLLIGACLWTLGSAEHRRRHGALLLLLAAWQLPFVLTHADIVRYRLPALPIAFVLQTLLVGHAIQALIERRRSRGSPVAAR